MADDAAQLLRVDASQYRRIGSDDRADRFEAIAGYIEQLEAAAARLIRAAELIEAGRTS